MKNWQNAFVFFLVIVVCFFAAHGYSNLALAAIYAVILLTGFTVFGVVALIGRIRAPRQRKTLVFCPVCKACFPVIPGEEDYENFMRRHGCRAPIHLSMLFGYWRKRGVPIWEPMKNEIFIARGGGGIFLVKRQRFDINEPLQYDVAPLLSRKAFAGSLEWILT